MAEVGSYIDDISNILQLELPYEKFSGCNILITGATGLIGGCLVEALMLNPNRDYSVYACGRNVERGNKRFQEYLNESGFYFFQQDVTIPFKCATYIIELDSKMTITITKPERSGTLARSRLYLVRLQVRANHILSGKQ